MRIRIVVMSFLIFLLSCSKQDVLQVVDNPAYEIVVPSGFPQLNSGILSNMPTKYGVLLGEKLFNDPQLSRDKTISCSSCHKKEYAFADAVDLSQGVQGRKGFRNTPSLANVAFLKSYTWDGSKLTLENHALVPIITKHEMDFSLSEIVQRIASESDYQELFNRAFGGTTIVANNILKALAQYQYTLVSSQSKYDRVLYGQGQEFTPSEQRGYQVFTQKCATCHSGGLFTDNSYRNIGFPINSDKDELGRARVTGKLEDLYAFRVPSLRNVMHTAPYGSFGQFATLQDVLEYIGEGVLQSENLDPIFKSQQNKIPLSKQQISDLIDFMATLSEVDLIES